MSAFFVFLIAYVVVVGGGGAWLKWALKPIAAAYKIGRKAERLRAMRGKTRNY